MPPTSPLTRYVGRAERTLQALLERQIEPAGLSFPEWTILTFLGGGTLPRAYVIALVTSGRIATKEDAELVLDGLVEKGMVAIDAENVEMTELGSRVYSPVRQKVDEIVQRLLDGLPAADMDVTRRTLDAIAARTEKLLSQAAA